MSVWPRRLASALLACGMVLAAGAGLLQSSAGHAQQGDQQGDDAALVRELAERLLTGPRGSPSPGGQAPTAQLLPGQLPPDLGLDLPMPPGARLLGSLARRFGDRPFNVEVVLDAPGAPSQVLDFYQQELAARGWTSRQEGFRGFPGGFQPGGQFAPPAFNAFCQSETGPLLMLNAVALERGGSDVRLSVQMPGVFPPAPFGGSFGPCSPPPSTPPVRPPPGGPELLPRLFAPPGVQLMPTGGAGGPNLAGSEALALTDRRAADLAVHFGQQLEEAGWQRVFAGADGPLAWSLWQVPGERGGQGLLVVLESPGENRVALSLRLYTSGPLGPPFGPPVLLPTPVPPIIVPVSPQLTDRQMAECLANAPDPALCLAPGPLAPLPSEENETQADE